MKNTFTINERIYQVYEMKKRTCSGEKMFSVQVIRKNGTKLYKWGSKTFIHSKLIARFPELAKAV